MYQLSVSDSSPLGNERETLTMRHTIQVMVDTLEAAQHSLARHEWNINELSPAGLWFQSEAALTHILLAGDEICDENWLHSFGILKEMTRINSQRWDIAGESVETILMKLEA